MATIKHWLTLLRISNLPTVWSNALAGYVLSVWVAVDDAADWMMSAGLDTALNGLRDGWALLVGFSLIYLGGMAMNDVLDAPLDARQRPTRPIPAGRISRRAATMATITLLILGLMALEVYRRWFTIYQLSSVLIGGVALVAAVTAYNALHQRTAWAILLMAACRGLVSFTAAMSVYWPFDKRAWIAVPALAIAVAAYTLIISTAAHGEDEAGPGRKRLVMGLIAAMPMVDAVAMLAIGQWGTALACAVCAPLALAGQRFVSGT